MLKVTYLESGLYLEYLEQSVEEWITQRVLLAVRMGHQLVVERSTASLLLPIDLVKRSSLVALLHQETEITVFKVDAEYFEIGLQGTWISSNHQGTEGVFVTVLNATIESVLLKLWQSTHADAPSIWR